MNNYPHIHPFGLVTYVPWYKVHYHNYVIGLLHICYRFIDIALLLTLTLSIGLQMRSYLRLFTIYFLFC